jgi:hypothetical protein
MRAIGATLAWVRMTSMQVLMVVICMVMLALMASWLGQSRLRGQGRLDPLPLLVKHTTEHARNAVTLVEVGR